MGRRTKTILCLRPSLHPPAALLRQQPRLVVKACSLCHRLLPCRRASLSLPPLVLATPLLLPLAPLPCPRLLCLMARPHALRRTRLDPSPPPLSGLPLPRRSCPRSPPLSSSAHPCASLHGLRRTCHLFPAGGHPHLLPAPSLCYCSPDPQRPTLLPGYSGSSSPPLSVHPRLLLKRLGQSPFTPPVPE